MLESHAKEVERISETRLAIIDPGATRTDMRARAYPGEDPATLKGPETVADAIVDLVVRDTPTGHRMRVDG